MGQRVLRISGELFVDMLGTGKRSYEVIENPIPADAKIVNATVPFPYYSGTNEMAILFESPEWPETPDGKPIEEIMPVLRRTDG